MFALRNWRILPVLLGLLLVSLVGAQRSEEFCGADTIIAQADLLGAKKDYDGAIQLLQAASERYPTYARVYIALANWQEESAIQNSLLSATDAEGRRAEFRRQLNKYPEDARKIFETYGRATMNLPDASEIRQIVSELTAQEFPTQLGEFGPLALPGDPVPMVYTVSDPRLPVEKRGTYQGLITSRPLPILAGDANDAGSGLRAAYATDPEYGGNPEYDKDPKFGRWTFNKILYAYDYDTQQQCWNLRFRVMWQDVRGQEANRARFARNSAQLLLRLYGLLRAYTDLTPLFAADGAINVWLAEKGDPGGEAFNENIYLQVIGASRSPTEWLRELAHEFGHETLPVVGGYVKPEWASNGILGERLFQRWLLLNCDPATEKHPWIHALKPDHVKDTFIDRYIRQFAELGPDAPQLTGTDNTAMDDFIGMALYLNETQGSANLATALKNMINPMYSGQHGFLQAVESLITYQQSSAQPSITLRVSDLPAHIPLWVYLVAGNWQGELATSDNTVPTATVEVDGRDAHLDLAGHFTTGNLGRGWHCIRLHPGDKAPDNISSLKLVKMP